MRKILLLMFLGLSYCTTDSKKTETIEKQHVSNADNEFVKYLELLPTVSLPFETNCEKCCDHFKLNYDNELITKFKPQGAAIVGLVRRSENRAIILVTYSADLIIPSLKVYDLNGKLTGDMNFMTGYCGGEPGSYSRQFFRIDKNCSLSQIDTLYETTIDSITYNTLDTINIKIERKEFIINDKGEIVEDNTHQESL